MEGKEAIIKEILNLAMISSQNSIENAKIKSSNIIDEAKQNARDYTQKNEQLLKSEISLITKKQDTLANLECKKIALNEKQLLVDEVFNKAVQMLKNMDGKNYLKLVDVLLQKYAQKGDVVLLAESDVIDAKAVENLDITNKLDLKVQVSNTVDGGIVLQGEKFDRELTFKEIVNYVREKIEPEIADKIFKE